MTEVHSVLGICKGWQKGPATNNCGPHWFYVKYQKQKSRGGWEGKRGSRRERKWRKGKGGAPHLPEGLSFWFSASVATFTLWAEQPFCLNCFLDP